MKGGRYEIRLGGSGGQGIILAAVILAEAAGIHDGYHVAQTQSYGPEARGGKSKAEVVVSDQEIDYPKVSKMDFFLAMNQASLDAYFFDFKPNGLLLVDSTHVEQVPTSRAVSLPLTRIAQETTGRTMAANMVALGAIGELCPMVSSKGLEQALLDRVPEKTRAMNLKAFEAGRAAAKELDLSRLPRSIMPDEEEEV